MVYKYVDPVLNTSVELEAITFKTVIKASFHSVI